MNKNEEAISTSPVCFKDGVLYMSVIRTYEKPSELRPQQ